jgi:hypothetical protein
MAIISNYSSITSSQFAGGFYNTGGSAAFQSGAAQSFTLDTWTQMSVSWDGTNIRSYINGSLTDTTNYSGLTASTGNRIYYIGRAWDSTNYITGELGELTLYPRALSATEITAYYTSTSNIYSV